MAENESVDDRQHGAQHDLVNDAPEAGDAPQASDAHGETYGTAPRDAPVSRADFERAIRSLHMSDLDLRTAVIAVGARIVALTDELTRRLDGVEPQPAPPNTPAAAPSATVEVSVAGAMDATLTQIHIDDIRVPSRVSIDTGGSKYEAVPASLPCAELMPLCQARCCTLRFGLSTEDLDEGVVRWDYGQPYLIRQRASDGYCVHNDPNSHGCTVHAFRPRVCRVYDCRNDKRIWIDYEQRIPAPPDAQVEKDKRTPTAFDLLQRAKARAAAIQKETEAIALTYSDRVPSTGPKPVE